MEMRFRIIEIHPETNQIVVRYYTDTLTENDFAIQRDGDIVLRSKWDRALTLPIPIPQDDALTRFIFGAAPWVQFGIEEQLRSGAPDLSHVNALLEVEFSRDLATHEADVKVAAILAADAEAEARSSVIWSKKPDPTGVGITER